VQYINGSTIIDFTEFYDLVSQEFNTSSNIPIYNIYKFDVMLQEIRKLCDQNNFCISAWKTGHLVVAAYDKTPSPNTWMLRVSKSKAMEQKILILLITTTYTDSQTLSTNELILNIDEKVDITLKSLVTGRICYKCGAVACSFITQNENPDLPFRYSAKFKALCTKLWNEWRGDKGDLKIFSLNLYQVAWYELGCRTVGDLDKYNWKQQLTPKLFCGADRTEQTKRIKRSEELSKSFVSMQIDPTKEVHTNIKRILSVDETAEYLQLKSQTVIDLLVKREIIGKNTPEGWRIPRENIDIYFKS